MTKRLHLITAILLCLAFSGCGESNHKKTSPTAVNSVNPTAPTPAPGEDTAGSTPDHPAGQQQAPSNTVKDLAVYPVSGAAVKGPLLYASVTAYSFDPGAPDLRGKLIAAGTTDQNAALQLGIPENELSRGPFLLEYVNGKELDGAAPAIPKLTTLVTRKQILEGTAVYATPVTEFVLHYARLIADGNDSATSIQPAVNSNFGGNGDGMVSATEFNAALGVASQHFKATLGAGVIPESLDIFTTSPILSTQSRQQDSLAYRIASETFSAIVVELQKASGEKGRELDANTAIEALALDLRDGEIDGRSGTEAIPPLHVIEDIATIIGTDPNQLTVPGTQTAINDLDRILAAESSKVAPGVVVSPMQKPKLVPAVASLNPAPAPAPGPILLPEPSPSTKPTPAPAPAPKPKPAPTPEPAPTPAPQPEPSPAPEPAPPITDGLLKLSFNEGSGTIASDSSGLGNQARLVGGPAYVSDTADGSPYALRFDGQNDYVDAGVIEPTGRALTLAAWFKADTFPGDYRDPRIISRASGTAEADHVFMLGTIKVGRQTALRVRLRVAGTTHTLIADNGALNTGIWQHAAATYNGNMLRLFLNGIEVGSKALQGSIDAAPGIKVAIGSQPGGRERLFDGLLDDIRILNRAMSATELRELARANSSSMQPMQPTPISSQTPAPQPVPLPAPQPNSTSDPEPEPIEKPAAGTEPIVAPAPGATTRSVTLKWTAPATRESGEYLSLGEIGSYEIYYTGELSGKGGTLTVRGGSTSNYTISSLPPDIYHFSMSAIDSKNVKSKLSDMVEVDLR